MLLFVHVYPLPLLCGTGCLHQLTPSVGRAQMDFAYSTLETGTKMTGKQGVERGAGSLPSPWEIVRLLLQPHPLHPFPYCSPAPTDAQLFSEAGGERHSHTGPCARLLGGSAGEGHVVVTVSQVCCRLYHHFSDLFPREDEERGVVHGSFN